MRRQPGRLDRNHSRARSGPRCSVRRSLRPLEPRTDMQGVLWSWRRRGEESSVVGWRGCKRPFEELSLSFQAVLQPSGPQDCGRRRGRPPEARPGPVSSTVPRAEGGFGEGSRGGGSRLLGHALPTSLQRPSPSRAAASRPAVRSRTGPRERESRSWASPMCRAVGQCTSVSSREIPSAVPCCHA